MYKVYNIGFITGLILQIDRKSRSVSMSNYDKKDRWAKRIETNLLITSDFVSQKV